MNRFAVLFVLLVSALSTLAAPRATMEERGQARLEQLAASLEKRLQATPPEDQHHALYQTALESLQRQLGAAPERVELRKGAGIGTVSGSVVRSVDGSAVAGATVRLVTSGFNQTQDTNSDDNGDFAYTDLPAGDYFLFAEPPAGENLAGAVFGNPGCAGDACFAFAYRGERIRIDPNTTENAGIQLQMEPSATLRGLAVDESDTPIPGATVTVFDVNAGRMFSVAADDAGSFEFTGLPAHDVALSVGSSDHTTTVVPNLPCAFSTCDAPAAGQWFTLTADESLDVGRITALPASFIEGTITSADTGAPVEGALVAIVDPWIADFIAIAVSDADGAYRVPVQPDFDQYVWIVNNVFGSPHPFVDQVQNTPCPRFWCFGELPEAPVRSARLGSIEVNVALRPDAPVSGRLVDAASGDPIAGAQISAIARGRSANIGFARTDENGEYRIYGLPADSYRLRADHANYTAQFYPGMDCEGCNPHNFPTTAVPPEGLAGIDFALNAVAGSSPQSLVQGTVVDEFQRSLDAVNVRLFQFGRGNGITGRSGRNGSFSRSNFAPGLYHAITQAPANIDQVYPGIECLPVCDLAQGQRIHIVDGTEIERLDFSLNYGASVRGVVADRETGAPLAYAGVRVHDLDSTGSKFVLSSPPGGHFILGGLPPGDYQIATDAVGRVNRSRNDIACYDFSCEAIGGEPTTLGPGEELFGVDFFLDRGGAVQGKVTKPGGEPAGYHFVDVTVDGLYRGFGLTTVYGDYYITGLPPGPFNMSTFRDEPGFSPTALPGIACLGPLCDPAALTTFEVSAEGPPTMVDIELLPGGTVSGTVSEALTGEPAAGLSVSIRNAGDEQVSSATSDGNGEYLAFGIPPGEYFVQAAVGDMYLRGQRYPDVECLEDGCTKGAGQPITVTAETPVENIDFALLRRNLFLTSPGISASWYDSGHDGEGFLIEMLDSGGALVYWFTYDKNGQQRWFIGTGAVVGATIEVTDFLEVTGPVFGDGFDPAARTLTRAGNAFFEFNGCGAGLVDFVIDGEIGHQDIGRLTSLEGVPCAEDAKGATNVRSGSWYGGVARDGEGFLVQFLGDSALVVWFTYGKDGEQMWLIGVGNLEGDEIVIDELQVTSGGRFGANFDPAEVERLDWGSLTLRLGCDSGEVAWAANDEAFGSGGYPVERLTRIDGTQCTEAVKEAVAAR